MPSIAGVAGQVLLYDPGAEGYLLETGWDLYDIPAKQLDVERENGESYGRPTKQWAYTPSYRQSDAGVEDLEPALMVIKEISVVCPRPRVILQDTLDTDFLLEGGSWETRVPLKPPLVKRLVQRSSEANYVWRADSNYVLPKNPNLAFTFVRLDHNKAENFSTYPGYVQVIISDSWAIRFSESWTAGVWAKVGGAWQQARHLELDGRGKEHMIWVMVRRGCLCISIDYGKKWEVIRGDTPISVPAGQIAIEGSGCQIAFGFHQIVLDDCSYESYDLDIMEGRYATPYWTSDDSGSVVPFGTSLGFHQIPSPPATFAYHVDFHVYAKPVVNLPFDMYDAPELWALLWSWNPTYQDPIGSSVDLVSLGVIDQIDITESSDIKSRHGSLNIIWDPTVNLFGSYGNRLVTVKLGWAYDDGSVVLFDRCAMYVVVPEPTADSSGWKSEIRFELQDLWARAAKTKVDRGWRPLDGWSCIQARNYILAKMGLPASRSSWYDTGLVLTAGDADKPLWWPKEGKSCAELFEAIDIYEGVESFVGADAQWTSWPIKFTQPTVGWVYDGLGGERWFTVRKVSFPKQHREQKTAVIVRGKDHRGAEFWGTAINYDMEENPSVPGFLGYRAAEDIHKDSIVTPLQAEQMAFQRLIYEDNVPALPEITVPANPAIYRGDQIQIINSGMVGIANTDTFRVEGLDFKYRPTKMETEVSAKCRMIIVA